MTKIINFICVKFRIKNVFENVDTIYKAIQILELIKDLRTFDIDKYDAKKIDTVKNNLLNKYKLDKNKKKDNDKSNIKKMTEIIKNINDAHKFIINYINDKKLKK